MSEKELKKQKRKEKREKVKAFLSDRRNKAIVKLCIYFIFFLFVIIYIRVMDTRKPVVPSSPNLPDTITTAVSTLNNDNYEYGIEYNYNNEIFKLTGKKYDNKYLIIYNENTYYYDGNLYLIGEEKTPMQSDKIKYLLMLDSKKVYNYLYNSKYNYKQEDANNNVTINSYMKLSDFGTLINEKLDNENHIIFNTVETNGTLTKVNIDLSNYIKVNEQDASLSVNITYKNINNVQDFNY